MHYIDEGHPRLSGNPLVQLTAFHIIRRFHRHRQPQSLNGSWQKCFVLRKASRQFRDRRVALKTYEQSGCEHGIIFILPEPD